MNLSDVEPLTPVTCPACGQTFAAVEMIGRFTLRSLLGRGGMGSVFRAYDPMLQRDVAIKVLRAKYSSDREYIDRLQQEAGLMAMLADPNVVRIYSTGEFNGRFYLAMELIQGGTLQDLLDSKTALSETQALTVAIQTASGLRAAYQRGVIHRDVKPGNILFINAHTVKITDFGLAESIDDAGGEEGEIIGTPYYISPERIDGAGEDFRSDLYSLGATLFHMLAGRPPFEGETAVAVALKRRDSEAVSVQTFAPHVSSATAYIVNATLRRSPAERPQSYEALIEQLTYAQNQLRAGTPRKRVVLEDEEHQKRSAIITAGVLAIAIVVGVLAFLFSRPKVGVEKRTPAPHPLQASAPAKAPSTVSLAFQNALGELSNLDFQQASAHFSEIASSSRAQPELQFSLICAGIAELAANDSAQAAKSFGALQQLQPSLDPAKDAAVLALTDAISRGSSLPANRDNPIAKLPGNEAAPLADMILGLKGFKEGELSFAADCLRRVRSSKAKTTGYPWMADLQPVASAMLEKHTRYQALVAGLGEKRNLRERVLLAAQLRPWNQPFGSAAAPALAALDSDLTVSNTRAKELPAAGCYQIINHHSKKALEIADGNTAEKAPCLQRKPDPAKTWQQFYLFPLGCGEYRIDPRFEPGMSMDVDSYRGDNGPFVSPVGARGNTAERWGFEKQQDGSFKIRAVCNGKVWAIDNASMDDNSKMIQYDDTGAEDQRWDLIPVAAPMPGHEVTVTDAKAVIDLSAADPSAGSESWLNRGTLGGEFKREGNVTRVSNVEGTGAPGVKFDSQRQTSYTGPNATPNIDGGSPRTIEAWVWKHGGLANEEAVVVLGRRGNDLRCLALNYQDSEWHGAASHYGTDLGWGPAVPATNTWHHFCYTYSGSVARVYCDGVLMNFLLMKAPLDTFPGEPVNIGCSREPDRVRSCFFNGYINSVRILDGALPAEQIAAHAAAGPARP